MARSYQQHCALARALDMVGERWTLLIVRELLVAPRRFRDLQENLRGIGPNLLSARLKELTALDIVRRESLPPPAGDVQVYVLGEMGHSLAPAVHALTRWGMQFLGDPGAGEYTRPEWDLVSMQALFDPAAARGRWLCVNLHTADDTVFHLDINDGTLRTALQPGLAADLEIRAPMRVLAGIAAGDLALRDALQNGLLQYQGRRSDLNALMDMFVMPAVSGAV